MDTSAADLHRSLIVIDGHCDTATTAAGIGHNGEDVPPLDITTRLDAGHVDFPRLLEGGVTAQFFALYTNSRLIHEARATTWRLLEAMEASFSSSALVIPGTRAQDVLDAKASGKLAAFLTIEGGEAIGESLDDLRAFHARGVRLMTLTWNRINAIGRGADNPGPDGLTPFGLRVVAEMERLGMIVDASHLCDQALDELLAVAQRPVVASHSNARALVPQVRNLTDSQAERIAATGGLVGATFVGEFVDPVPANVSLSRFIDHVDHLVSVAGIEHVGLGSDFDGFEADRGLLMPDCSQLPALTAGLAGRGYTEAGIRAIMGGNWLRVMKEILG
jgi:membrane dipeptidase